MYSGCTVLPDSKQAKCGSSDQEASPSESKNARVVLLPCCGWKFVLTTISSSVDISNAPGCHLLQQMSSE